MAARDIMPWHTPHGSQAVQWGQMTSGEAFEAGEPIAVVDAGTLSEPTQNNVEWLVTESDIGFQAGIAAFGPGASNINPRTGVAFTALDDIAYWPVNQGTVFITKNFYTAAAAATVAPTQAEVGESYQITYATATSPAGWGIEVTAGDTGLDFQANIIEVLDTNKDPIRLTGGTGVYVLFTIDATIGAA